MSTIPSPEIWNNILKDNAKKDDSLWTEYLDKAAVFDVRMVDEGNKIVDVLLVYVALFISVLTSFIATTTPHFQRNPADITNDLLVEIYKQLAAQSNNTPITPVDPESYLNQSPADYDSVVIQNGLLYTSLSLSIIVSVVALVAKLWLVGYSQQAFSVGSPYDRAMRRQLAFNGVLEWHMRGVINVLPVILLIALYLFGFYVYTSVFTLQEVIGSIVGALLSVGLVFLGLTSFGAAFIPGCPFRSAFSSVIRFIFEKLRTLSNRILRGCLSEKELQRLWILSLLILFVALVVGGTLVPGIWFLIFFLQGVIPFAIMAAVAQVYLPPHTPQKSKIFGLALLAFIFVSLWAISFFAEHGGIVILVFALLSIFIVSWFFGPISMSMGDTGEIDAVAWLLKTTPQYPQAATFFKKAGQMIGVDSSGRDYRSRLLESLMPLLSPYIISYHAPEHHSPDNHSSQTGDVLNGRPRTSQGLVDDEGAQLKDIEIYTACLARLSEFEDYKGGWRYLWADARRHPTLEQPLIVKLVELFNSQHHSLVGVRSTVTKVLKNFKLGIEGNPLSATTDLESVATDLRGEATSMPVLSDNGLNSQEQGHPDPATHVEPATHVDPATPVEPTSPATSMINDSVSNSQVHWQRHPELYRPMDPATPVEPAISVDLVTPLDPATHVDQATRVEPVGAGTSTFNLDS